LILNKTLIHYATLITDFVDSDSITEFLVCATAWPLLTEDKIKIRVGSYDQISFHTCFNTLEIPQDMEEDNFVPDSQSSSSRRVWRGLIYILC
jgi:hypothetical protein